MVYTMVYIMVYMVYIMPVCSYLDMRPGAAPQKISLCFRKKPQKSCNISVFRNILTFYQKSRRRNLSRIRDLVNIFLFCQGFVSKLARGEKL